MWIGDIVDDFVIECVCIEREFFHRSDDSELCDRRHGGTGVDDPIRSELDDLAMCPFDLYEDGFGGLFVMERIQ